MKPEKIKTQLVARLRRIDFDIDESRELKTGLKINSIHVCRNLKKD